MTMLINLETKQELTDSEFRFAHQNTSFGPVIDYVSFGYAVVYPTPHPAHDPVIQTVRRLPAVLTDKGHYEQAWEVVPRFDDYTDENGITHTVAAQEAAAIADAQARYTAALVAQYDAALSNHLDTTAQSRRYDNRITCALRAGYVGPFQAEGAAFAAWMDACNAQAYAIMGEVMAGTRPLPTVDGFLSLLPALEWPQ